jgi:hypothetical protein
MRSLNRNKRKLYYALYAGDESVYDEYGNETGEIRQSYGEATEYYGNVSAATGEEAVQAFGSFTNYSRTLSVADNNCPIAENSVIWFGVNPTEPYNYIVVRKADSKNGILYALQEVTVSRL